MDSDLTSLTNISVQFTTLITDQGHQAGNYDFSCFTNKVIERLYKATSFPYWKDLPFCRINVSVRIFFAVNQDVFNLWKKHSFWRNQPASIHVLRWRMHGLECHNSDVPGLVLEINVSEIEWRDFRNTGTKIALGRLGLSWSFCQFPAWVFWDSWVLIEMEDM